MSWSHLLRMPLKLLALLFVLVGPAFAAPVPEMRASAPMEDAWAPPSLPDGFVELPGAAFTIAGPADQIATLDRLAKHGAHSVLTLSEQLGVPLGGPIHVYMAADDVTFARLQPGLPPAWADGTAWPKHGVIFLRTPDSRGGLARPLEQVLDHELVHVLVGRAFLPAHPPTWLQEGLAQVYAGEVGADHVARLRRGLLHGGAIPLRELVARFPADAMRADLAYAESADVVLWLRGEHGDAGVAELIATAARTGSAATALHAVTGLSLADLDAAWAERLAFTPSVLFDAANLEAIVYAAGGVGLLFVGWQRRRARNARLADWRAQDAKLNQMAREILWRRHERRAA